MVLAVVQSQNSPPPYAETVKARGWSFDLDPERLEASDTWALAPAEIRPWLLMLWFRAWQSIPCGSLPPDDAVIAARIGMPLLQFQTHRAVLMRGWWRAVDGRLYHPVITERVLNMIERRREHDEAAIRRGQASAAARREKYGTAQPSKASRKDVESESKGLREGSDTARTTPTPTPTPTTSKDTQASPESPRLTAADPNAQPDRIPFEKIVAAYHELLPMLPKVAVLTEARRANIRQRWKSGSLPDLETWRAYFTHVAASRFLTGQSSPAAGRDRPFTADFEWLCKEANFVKVWEGRYHRA